MCVETDEASVAADEATVSVRGAEFDFFYAIFMISMLPQHSPFVTYASMHLVEGCLCLIHLDM
jgi:hypothetical protein